MEQRITHITRVCDMCLLVGILNAAHSYRDIISVVRPRSDLGSDWHPSWGAPSCVGYDVSQSTNAFTGATSK